MSADCLKGVISALGSDSPAGGPRPESGCAGFSGERHRHPRHVAVLPHLLPAGAIQPQPRPSQEGRTQQVGGETTEVTHTAKLLFEINLLSHDAL